MIGELKVYGTFFDDLCLTMKDFRKNKDSGAAGNRTEGRVTIDEGRVQKVKVPAAVLSRKANRGYR